MKIALHLTNLPKPCIVSQNPREILPRRQRSSSRLYHPTAIYIIYPHVWPYITRARTHVLYIKLFAIFGRPVAAAHQARLFIIQGVAATDIRLPVSPSFLSLTLLPSTHIHIRRQTCDRPRARLVLIADLGSRYPPAIFSPFFSLSRVSSSLFPSRSLALSLSARDSLFLRSGSFMMYTFLGTGG